MFHRMDDKSVSSKGPKLLEGLADICSHALVELLGLEKEKADQAGREIAEQLSIHWGGQLIYVPKGLAMQLPQRYQEIYEAFTGNNHHELARRFDLSVPWVYRIIDRVKRADIAARQPSLF